MTVTAIFGGPGTGKTRRLGQLYRDKVIQYGSENVAFISYTRQQVNRDRQQAKKATGIKAKKLSKRFRTLHSTARQYYTYDTAVIDEHKMERMSVYLDADMQSVARGIDFMRNTMTRNQSVGANRAGMDTRTFQKYAYFYERVKEGSSQPSARIIDFTDMIEDAVNDHYKIDVKCVFIDEAQDLSPLQWKAVYTFFRDAEELFVAGDPNQALYRFSGGQADYMLEMRCDHSEVLPVSHRCCKSVMEMAGRVWKNIDRKSDIPLANDREDGFAVFYPQRNIRKFLNPVLASVQRHRKVMVLAQTYFQLRQIKDIMFNGREYPHDFLSGQCKYHWKDRRANPIVFSTVHQAKGLEADIVIYDVSCGRTAEKNDFGTRDNRWQDYYRLVYTGITRAKYGLVLFEFSKTLADEPSCLGLLYYTKFNFDRYRRWVSLTPSSGEDSKR